MEEYFENINQNHNSVIEGVHITCPSVVDETRDYIRKNSILGIFIDPEIGHMAKACNESKIQFSYLHIISDNVAKLHKQNLSNERRIAIIKKKITVSKNRKNYYRNNKSVIACSKLSPGI